MIRADFIAAMTALGWEVRMASPRREDGTAHYMRLRTPDGLGTSILMNESELRIESPDAFGERCRFGSAHFPFAHCTMDVIDGECVSISSGEVFVNFYNHK